MRFEEGVIRRLRRLHRLEIAAKKKSRAKATGWVFRPPAVAILKAKLLSV
jgi:hypothetical protein